jgi:hypothetical protein
VFGTRDGSEIAGDDLTLTLDEVDRLVAARQQVCR